MLPTIQEGHGTPALVLMHLFGSAKREWTECISALSPRYRCIALDLPGFGDAAGVSGYSVDEMVRSVEGTLRSLRLDRFVLVGHSMSGKVALAIAARKFAGLAGLVLVAPSPPSPEPMTDEGRRRMLAMKRDRMSAESFLDGITAQPLAGMMRERAIEDFMQCSPAAWTAWLESGSREDWTARIAIVGCPALIVTGTDDPSLSAPVQKSTTMKSLSDPRLEIIARCGHLPTMETPEKLSALMSHFVDYGLSLR